MLGRDTRTNAQHLVLRQVDAQLLPGLGHQLVVVPHGGLGPLRGITGSRACGDSSEMRCTSTSKKGESVAWRLGPARSLRGRPTQGVSEEFAAWLTVA